MTTSLDKTAKLWNIEDGSLVKTFNFSEKPEIGDQQVGSFWYKDTIVTISFRGDINFLDINNPDAPLKKVKAHQAFMSGLVSDRNSGSVYTADSSGRILKWEQKSNDGLEFAGVAHEGNIVALCANSTGSHLLTVSIDDTMMSNDTSTLEFGVGKVDLGGQPADIAPSPSDPELVYVASKKQKILRIKNGAIEGTIDLQVKPAVLAIKPDESQFAIASV